MRLLAAVWAPVVCLAQTRIDPADKEGRQIVEAFEANWNSTRQAEMKCRAQPIEPRMGFSFRFWTGFQAFVPMEGFLERETRLVVLIRVRARSKKEPGEPVYFIEGGLLPEASKRNWREAVFSGGVYVGPGAYEIAFIVGDDRQRVCKQQSCAIEFHAL